MANQKQMIEYDWNCIKCYDWTAPETIDLDENDREIVDIKEPVICKDCGTKMIFHPRARNNSFYRLIKAP